MTRSSYCLRMARLAASVASTNLIMGSSEAWIAAMPPSHSVLRTAGSPSLDWARRADRFSGELLAQEGFGARRVGGEIFAQLGQPIFQHHLLQFRIDRLRIEQRLAQQCQAAVGIFRQAVAIGLGLFRRCAHQDRARSGKDPSRCRRAPPSCNRENRAHEPRPATLAISLQGSPISAARAAIGRDLGFAAPCPRRAWRRSARDRPAPFPRHDRP